MLIPLFSGEDDVEVLYGIFLDVKNHIIDIQELSRGTLTAAAVYPREVIKKVIALKAAALVLAHNDTLPSSEDKEITAKIGLILHAMGATLHDHTIIGNGHHSMADSGWIRQAQSKFQESISRICR